MKKVSFCGISGTGMSALAQILKARGVEVRGSDRCFDQGKDTENRKALEDIGITIFPQDGTAISNDLDCLYVSTAVEDSIPDVKAALEKNITIKKRSDLLAEIFNAAPQGIAVGGTSGKTTVTAMIGYILDVLGKKPTIINGGILKNYINNPGIPNVVVNQGGICVIEADESDGSIEKYIPYIAVINNITIDHKSIDELKKLFYAFAGRATAGAVVNLDCPDSHELLTAAKKTVTFSITNPKADIFVSNITPLQNGIAYQLGEQKFHLKLTGSFNASNAAAAIAACTLLGIDKYEAARALENFLGTKRRLDIIGTAHNITVIDDFAHNPAKVYASMSALRDYPGRVLVIFQPHGFAPMRMTGRQIMESFAETMQPDDMLFMPEIFYAGGTAAKDISSAHLAEYARSIGVNARFYTKREEIKTEILQLACPGDRIIVMGARDNSLTQFCEEILQGIKQCA